jgi:hypothetical protein
MLGINEGGGKQKKYYYYYFFHDWSRLIILPNLIIYWEIKIVNSFILKNGYLNKIHQILTFIKRNFGFSGIMAGKYITKIVIIIVQKSLFFKFFVDMCGEKLG